MSTPSSDRGCEKAVTYRRVEKISGLRGTAVNIVQMVFGNMGEDSGTGSDSARSEHGENTFYGDSFPTHRARVVAGIRTPVKLSRSGEDARRLLPAREGPSHPREAYKE